MNKLLYINVENFVLFIVSFFLYAGYYAGLELIISLGLKDYSRIYSIPLRFIIAMAITYFLLKKIQKKYNKKMIFFLSLFILFFCHYSLMIFLNIHEQLYMLGSFEYIFYLITWSVLIFFYFLNFDLNKFDILLRNFIYSGFLMGVTSFVLYKDFFLSGGGRISQMIYEDNTNFVSPLVLSYASVFNFILFFSYIKDYKNKSISLNILVFLMVMLSIPMFILGASRGAFIACILGFIYIWFFSELKSKILSMIIVPIFICVIYLITIKTGNNAFDRFFNIKNDVESNSSSASRLELWYRAWEYFKDSPLYGGYLEVDGNYPHNIFFEIAMNTGLIGLLLFFVPFTYFCIYILIIKNIKGGYFIPLLFILGFSMHLFSGALYFAPILFTALGLVGNKINNKGVI